MRLDTALECIEKSRRAKSLATNARMLSEGVIPCLFNDISSAHFDVLYDDTNEMKEKLLEHLLEPSKDNFLFSFPGVRKYMSLKQ